MATDNGHGATTREHAHDVAERLGAVATRARRTLSQADRSLSTKMQENPLLVLGIAVGIGYVIGRVFSRVR